MKLKRPLSLLLLLVLTCALLPGTAQAAGPNGSISVQVYNEATRRYDEAQADVVSVSLDGEVLDFSSDVPGLAMGSRTMVPVRVISERMGGTVLAIQDQRQVILRRGTNTVVLTLGSPTALVNGQEVDLPDGVPACVVKRTVDGEGVERTMVPLRFVSEQLGAKVDWDQPSYTASITQEVSATTYITRVVADSDRQTVLIATDREAAYVVSDYDGKVVVDVLGAELSSGFPGTITVDNDLITTVRYAQHEDDLYPDYAKTVRVVLDLREGITLEKNVTVEKQEGGILLTTFLTDEDRKDDKPFVPSTPIDPDKKTVVIDPGHGGSRSGAVYEGIMEKDINLSVSLKLEKLLEDRGYNVVMTRTTDIYMDLYDRSDIANDVGADLFVSIHSNAIENNNEVSGIITYYHPSSKRGERLAGAIQGPVCKATGAKDRGISSADFVVLRETNMCAVLVEMGFMTNHDELMKLNDPAYQDKLAEGIAEGIVQYLNQYGS